MAQPIVNLVHSLPALDMALALVLELRSQGRVGRIETVLKFGDATRIPSVDFLFETVCHVSDHVVLVGSSPLYDVFSRIADRLDMPYDHLQAWRAPKIAPGLNRLLWALKRFRERPELSRYFDSIPHAGILLRSHADVDEFSESMVAAIRQRGGKTFAYLEGCYPPRNALPISYFKQPRVDWCDRFLLYTEAHHEEISRVGYSPTTIIGYTKLYRAWKAAVEKSRSVTDLKDESQGYTVSVFTRGENPGGGPQIMPNTVFEPLLDDLLSSLEDHFDSPRILIKPHPAQDVATIERATHSRPGVRLTTLHPSQLAAVSDLVITTWSTSTVDALAFGVPCIEYFVPNDYFFSVYPHGSSFRQLGILWAEDSAGFRRCLDQITAGEYEMPDVEAVFEHREDLSIFGPGSSDL